MILYKYYNLSLDYNKKAIEQGYFYFSKPSEINDIYDCKPIFIHNYDSKKDNLDSLRENIDYKVKDDKIYNLNSKQHSDVLRILSLSLTNDSVLMWSHYSGNKGICIGYDLSIISHNSKNYYCIKTINNHIKNQGSFLGNNDQIPFNMIKYKNINYFIPYEKTEYVHEMINNTILKKQKIWKYEKEWRAVITEIESNTQEIYYDKSIIKEVIFGLNTKPEDINFIKETCGESVKYFYATRSLKRKRMDIIPKS